MHTKYDKWVKWSIILPSSRGNEKITLSKSMEGLFFSPPAPWEEMTFSALVVTYTGCCLGHIVAISVSFVGEINEEVKGAGEVKA